MDEPFRRILEKTREFSFRQPIRRLNFENLIKEMGFEMSEVTKYVKSKKALVTRTLEYERECFMVIFDNNDFEGVNAIDILYTVSKELGSRFKDINPGLTSHLRQHYPEIYRKHLEMKYDFIFGKIKINIEKGIRQGMYRDDLSVELVGRLYMARLMDIHDPALFPPGQFSFEVLFEHTIDSFVRSIATDEGLKHYKDTFRRFKTAK